MILITGATGRSGSKIVQEFAKRGERVRALVRDRAKARIFENMPSVEVVEGDMLRPETLGQGLDGVSRALMISNAGPALLETQCTFIDTAVRAGVEHIVKFSGKDSIDDFDSFSFRSTRGHDQVERYLTASSLSWTILLPSQFMQVYFEEVPTIRDSGEIRLPLGETTLAPVDIEDIAQIAYAVLTSDGHHGARYPMTGPESLTMTEIARFISEATGTSIHYRDVSPDEKLEEWTTAGYPPERAQAFLQLFAERKRLKHSSADLSSHQLFGVKPTTFLSFAERNAEVFRGNAPYATTPV